VADGLQLESMGVEPVGRKSVLAVLRELLWLVEDDGIACTCPLVCFADDRSARDQETKVMEAGVVTRITSWFLCLVEEHL
jgi:hypothetical protein